MQNLYIENYKTLLREFKGDLNKWRDILCLSSGRLGTSLVAHWLRIRLPMQGTCVRALVREGPACCGATKPIHAPQLLSLCSRAREPQLLSPHATTTEAHVPRACALQQEKLPQ